MLTMTSRLQTSPCVELGASPRLDKLLNAEAEVLKVGGNVVRLAGLYLFDRGAHTFWVTRETVPGNPDSFVNLIHYEVRGFGFGVEILFSYMSFDLWANWIHSEGWHLGLNGSGGIYSHINGIHYDRGLA
jgi:hypothetical protein